MSEVINVRFRGGYKTYFFDPRELTVKPGEDVIVETAKGPELCTCTVGNHEVEQRLVTAPLRPVLRIATEEDKRTAAANRAKEPRAFEICQQKIQEFGLDMKLVRVEYSFDGSKILFFFTSEGRVDFREMVRSLASIFRTRIELRQIGVRDEAKLLGGIGVCGRPFCCSGFLDQFQPVSIKMAKTQSISLNPTKISGVCGRLMCCLKYEQDAYEDLLRDTPKLESLVKTPDGVGVVNQIQLLREQVKVVLDHDPDSPKLYHKSEIDIIRNGKGKRPPGYEFPVQPPEKPAQPRFSREEPMGKPLSPAPAEAGSDRTQESREKQGQRKQQAADQKSGQKKSGRSRRHRSGKKGGGQAQPAQNAAGKQQPAAGGEKSGGHSRSRSHHRRRHRPKGQGGNSTPKPD